MSEPVIPRLLVEHFRMTRVTGNAPEDGGAGRVMSARQTDATCAQFVSRSTEKHGRLVYLDCRDIGISSEVQDSMKSYSDLPEIK